jgi:hypothetical protein
VQGPSANPPIALPPDRDLLRALVHGRIRPCDQAHGSHINKDHHCCRGSDGFESCLPPAPYWKFLEYNNLEFRGRVYAPVDLLPPERPPLGQAERAGRPEPARATTADHAPPPAAIPVPDHRAHATDRRRAPGARFRIPPAPISGRLIDLFI